MNKYTIGLWAAIIYMLIDFAQIHTIIPGVKHLKLGFISGNIAVLLVLTEFFRFRWIGALSIWTGLFVISVIPGLVFGVTNGLVFKTLLSTGYSFIAFFLGLSIFTRGFNDLRKLNTLLIWISFAVSLYVLTHGGHGPGALVDENDVGLVLVMLLPFSYFSIGRNSGIFKKIFCFAVFFTSLIAIAATFSRGAMVGTLPTLGFIWLRSKNKFASLAILFLVIVVVVISAPERLINEFQSIQNTDSGTAASRLYFWQLSTEMFFKRPIFGVGALCWGNAIWSGLVVVTKAVPINTPHSIYFQLIAELGLFGTIPWIIMIYTCFKILRQHSFHSLQAQLLYAAKVNTEIENDVLIAEDMYFASQFATCLQIGLIGGLISGVFLSFLFYPHLFSFIALAHVLQIQWRDRMAFAMYVPEHTDENEKAETNKDND